MATKQEVATQGKQQADLVINNALIDGLTAQLNEKCKYGMSFPADYNLANALTGAYLVLKETTDKNGKPLLETCSQISIANSLMDMATLRRKMPVPEVVLRKYHDCPPFRSERYSCGSDLRGR